MTAPRTEGGCHGGDALARLPRVESRVPAVPAVPARPFPSSELDEDIRLGIADWLRNYSMPIELTA